MCCNGTLHQKHKHPKKETFSAKPQQCIQHLTPGWKWYHQPFNAKIPATSYYTQNSKIPFKEILPFFSQIHEMTSSAVWDHPTDLICFYPKQTAVLWQLSQDSCHSFFFYSWDNFLMIAVTAFPDSWDSFFQDSCDSWPSSLHITDFSTFG